MPFTEAGTERTNYAEARIVLLERARRVWTVLRDDRGIETLEWVLIGGLITAMALVVYSGSLQGNLVTAVTSVGAAIAGAV